MNLLTDQARAEAELFRSCLEPARQEAALFGQARRESLNGAELALEQISAVIRQTNAALDTVSDRAAVAAALQAVTPAPFPERIFP
ncbi:hypothetical protein M1D80_11025 [Phyllobacteriaceae bacterium JZ32]